MLADKMTGVISFYKRFDDTFSKVDKAFSEIDNKGGIDNTLLENIIDQLLKYQADCYKEDSIIESSNDFEKYLSQIESENQICGLLGIVRTIQKETHDILVSDTVIPDKKNLNSILEKCLLKAKVLKNDIGDDKDNIIAYYAFVRIIRELVADCSISIKGLEPISPWKYGTVEYSKLKENEKLMVSINQAILTDRMYFSLPSLRSILFGVNKLLDGFEAVNWRILYAAGLLNFKIHQYTPAKDYFKKIRANSLISNSKNSEIRKIYFHASLLIAYCEEYSGEFANAIMSLAVSVDTLQEILKEFELKSINEKFTDIMVRVCDKSKENEVSLIRKYITSYSDFSMNANNPENIDEDVLDMQFEILHALAHCINEYAIKKKLDESNPTGVFEGKLIELARTLMYSLASFRPDYWTCYATMHGEYQDYNHALEELNAIKERFISAKQSQKETVEAEICFFKYYFGLLSNKIFKKAKDKFEDYSIKYDDDDAKCHIKIFEFRENLRRYCIDFFNRIQDISNDEEEYSNKNVDPVPENLMTMYEELCELDPTLYMNINVRAELRLMQRSYESIVALREYLIAPTRDNYCLLENSCKRFIRVKSGFDHNLATSGDQDDEKSGGSNTSGDFKVPSGLVSDAFSRYGIFSSLYSSDSIFILAPISGIIVYQYQTGNIKNLFSIDDILPKSLPNNEKTDEQIEAIVNLLCENHREIAVRFGQPKLDKIPWDEFKVYTDKFYYWSEAISTQVVVATKDGGSHIERVKDENSLTKSMLSLRNSLTNNRGCNKWYRNETCLVQVRETMPWMEVINDQSSKNVIFVIIWTNDLQNEHACFIVPVKLSLNFEDKDKVKKERHKIHRHLSGIKPEYNMDEEIEVDEEDEGGDGSNKEEKVNEKQTKVDEVSLLDPDHNPESIIGKINLAKSKCDGLLINLRELLAELQKRVEENGGKTSGNGRVWETRRVAAKEDKQYAENQIVRLSDETDKISIEEVDGIISYLGVIEERIGKYYGR